VIWSAFDIGAPCRAANGRQHCIAAAENAKDPGCKLDANAGFSGTASARKDQGESGTYLLDHDSGRRD
jgi:hypothetical protein